MKYLLDTQAVIWFFEKNPKLGSQTRLFISEHYTEIAVSYVSVWETTIKISLGKLQTRQPIETYIERASLALLPISLEHIRGVGSLPFIHRDPFDRMLIAQALYENLALLTSDTEIMSYPVLATIDARK